MPTSTAKSNTEMYQFFNNELKEIYGKISQINERLAVLETRGEDDKINTDTIVLLNSKLDMLNNKIADNAIKTKPNWVQVGKIIGLIITGIAAVVGSYFAGAS
jgi:hypothetical protein